MTKETFLVKTERGLEAHLAKYPFLEGWDSVKYVFQAMLGPGHLIPSRERAAELIARETLSLGPDPSVPLTEAVGPLMCRLDLARAAAEGITPDVIAGMMVSPGPGIAFDRREVYDACLRIKEAGRVPMPEAADLARITDPGFLPSHSPVFRERRRPSYRVISSEWIPCLGAVAAIARKKAASGPLTVTLDGPCASGKTTLAARLAPLFRADVLHTDDFVIPHAQKTPERLAVPGGNCDAERLVREVLSPRDAGRDARFRRYDCRTDRLLPEEILPADGVLILEGSYSNLPALREYADVRLFLSVPREVRERRLKERESPDSLSRFRSLWIPLEDAYFSFYGLPDEGCTVISFPGGPNGDPAPAA